MYLIWIGSSNLEIYEVLIFVCFGNVYVDYFWFLVVLNIVIYKYNGIYIFLMLIYLIVVEKFWWINCIIFGMCMN